MICLFSDTLQRAIQKEMISQDMVDLYDPRYNIYYIYYIICQLDWKYTELIFKSVSLSLNIT